MDFERLFQLPVALYSKNTILGVFDSMITFLQNQNDFVIF